MRIHVSSMIATVALAVTLYDYDGFATDELKEDLLPGFDAAPADVLPERDLAPGRRPTRDPVADKRTLLDERGYVIEASFGRGTNQGQITRQHAKEHFDRKAVIGKVYRLRLMVVADRREDIVGSYYVGLQRIGSDSHHDYGAGQIGFLNQVTSYQVGYNFLWTPWRIRQFMIGGEVDVGVAQEEVHLRALTREMRQSQFKPSLGTSLSLLFYPLPKVYLHATGRLDSQVRALSGGIAYAF